MVMEKPSAQLVGREFVRQYYTLLNQAPDYLHRFYGKNSSYVHGGLDNNGKPAEAVYGQSEIHKKVMALSFRDCHTKIRHVDAHATLNEGVVVQVLGGLSNNMQPMRKFMQTFVLAPEGTVANKFYVHNDIFRYQDEVFGDSDSEPPEESEEDVEELERVHSPEVVQEESSGYYEQTPCVEPEVPQEEVSVTPEPQPEPEVEVEPEPAAVELKAEPISQPEVHVEEKTQRSPPSPTPADTAPTMPEDNRPSSWASVTSKNLPPGGVVPATGVPPHVVRVPSAQPRVEVKTETQTTAQRPQRDQRPRDQRPGPSPAHRTPRPGVVREGESGESEVRRTVRYPDSHQLFVGNVPHDVDKNELKEFFEQYGTVLELRINSGGKLPNFGFVVFDDSEPVQKILNNRPIKLRGDVRLNVEEKKTRSAREGDRRDIRPRGPGGPRDRIGGSRGPPTRGGMAQKPSFGAGRGTGPSEGRYTGPRQ
ncbi:ras GTPase-activating protein-binding protein 1 [Danio rerio]|uniref:GTPase activating protein (SH3 domain) binding protein 1 n=1 Tax=Danio rerio TaxID=7955 RepID=Q7ZVG3_DANRE|nr:ras GTPase-activating protein-binding protein 1 [Danio rerio]AAH45874.1 GTPase activating protein (SH3 domain) binding protein 1 [Danio rerio]|eukprot:NP_956250.1 ras GTPase-activating protein-binding protein 1 [Danio rerio]